MITSKAIRQYPIAPVANACLESVDKQQLTEALLVSLAEYRDQLQGRRIWLACSGGRDSLALAALCLQLYQQGKLPFLPQLLHVNHGLQADSSHWAQHVADWAYIQQMPCHILSAQVNGHDEQAARQARYRVMLAQINQGDVLLLAHHADDQAETILMRLIQGAGVKGLAGMQPWREQAQGAHTNILWRPWLTVRRTAITAYAEQLKLPYIDDPTNDSGDNVRSGLRLEVIPALAAYNPNVIDNIARSAQLLADAQAIVNAQAEQDLQQTAIESLSYPPAQRVLNIDEIQTLPPYRQRQLLHFWLSQDEPLPPSKQLIDDVLSLSQRHDYDHQTQLQWQGRRHAYTIRCYRQHLYRLSQSFLNWLTLPIAEQTQSLPTIMTYKNNVSSDPTTITLRSNERYKWQLQITENAINNDAINNDLISNNKHALLKVALLGRKQRLQTALATRPKSGKKLYQTLGIPVWLRDSLVVVSVVSNMVSNDDEELPLLLVSPFNSWVLGLDVSMTDNMINELLGNGFSSILQVLD
ncbi:tRNA lysidine(34) synthetase TilS [Psychrobacter urativorans]|uniref:tRNA lysidine(34) synthetase TilS n=1 Tax=Psychrobacter urativorans TaxID=45610 RepID=UPI001D0FC780|nr:tRNA lysidine(34) synthetase TilS [Psychrobacter urativorans]